jgi:hypothetical protein
MRKCLDELLVQIFKFRVSIGYAISRVNEFQSACYTPFPYLHGTTLQCGQRCSDISKVPAAAFPPTHQASHDMHESRDPCNRLAAGFRQVHIEVGRAAIFNRPHMRLPVTYIECLNSAVENNIGAQAGCRPADDDVIINRHTFCPQAFALLGSVLGVVLERDGSRMAVGRVGAHTTGMPPVVLPVRRNYAIALWTNRGDRRITSRRGSAVVRVR